LLEAGCGTGLLLGRFAARADRAVGLDLSAGMLSRARGRGLDVVQGDLRHLPFADASFDVTCAFKVLAHVPERDAAVAELARVTRPGGTLFLEFYNRRSLRYLARRAAGARAIGTRHTEDDVPTRWDTPAELARAFPADLRLRRWHGVRVVTPFGAALSQPGSGRSWPRWSDGCARRRRRGGAAS
jgi:SAM-dependent methyltransferase